VPFDDRNKTTATRTKYCPVSDDATTAARDVTKNIKTSGFDLSSFVIRTARHSSRIYYIDTNNCAIRMHLIRRRRTTEILLSIAYFMAVNAAFRSALQPARAEINAGGPRPGNDKNTQQDSSGACPEPTLGQL
jgi:hypothetical protein